jgi:hypothetical protein
VECLLELEAVSMIDFVHRDTYWLNTQGASPLKVEIAVARAVEYCRNKALGKVNVVHGASKQARGLRMALMERIQRRLASEGICLRPAAFGFSIDVPLYQRRANKATSLELRKDQERLVASALESYYQ